MNSDTQTVQIPSPPGYGTITPLNRQAHAGLGLADQSFAWARQLNSVYLSAAEISRAALDYPIGFVRDVATSEFFPVAVLGLRNNENLFVNANNNWVPYVYLPAYMRRFPFCVVDLPANAGATSAQQLICVDESRLTRSDTPFFDEKGQATALWAPRQQLIESLQGAQQFTRTFMKRLEGFGLLVPCDAVAMPSGRPPLRLNGLFRIDEAKLGTFSDADLRQMLAQNELRVIYAHLLSLENFTKLMLMTVEADGRRDQAH